MITAVSAAAYVDPFARSWLGLSTTNLSHIYTLLMFCPKLVLVYRTNTETTEALLRGGFSVKFLSKTYFVMQNKHRNLVLRAILKML